MFWDRLSKIDRFLVIGAAIVMVLSSALIFEDRWIFRLLASSDQMQERIGSVKTAVRDVRRRHSTAFSWLPLDTGNPVYQGDSIYTADNSEAVITTDRGEQISISPNSLVVINSKTDSIRLDIDYGSVLGQVGKSKKLQIASGGDVTEFEGDDAVVKVDVGSDKNLSVNVLEGQVQVSSDEGVRMLGPRQQAEIGEAGAVVEAADAQIDLLSPVPDRVLRPDEIRDLVLTWRSTYDFKEYAIEIARDPDFQSVIVKETTLKPLFRPSLLPTNERLFWRVTAKIRPEQNPTKSLVSGFTLAEDLPPTIGFPRDGMRISFEEQPGETGNQLQLAARWTAKSASAKWDLQLAQSPDFAQGLKIFDAAGTSLNLGYLNEGNYVLRVRAKDWSNAKWSEPVSFSIFKRPAATLRPPAVVTAEEEFQLVTKSSSITEADLKTATKETFVNFVESVPELAWNTIPGATSYEIEISPSRDFQGAIERAEVPNTRFAWMDVKLGQYYWRIRSVSAGNRKGPFTQAQRLKIKLAPPTSLTDEKIVEEITSMTFMDAAPPPFVLRWVPTLFTAGYELQFDRDAKFTKPLTVITKNPFKKVQAPQAGLYFWRVRALNSESKPQSEWSMAQRYEYARTFVSSESSKELKAIYPNNDTVMLIGSGEIKINFTWTTPIKTAKYHFQLSQTEDFSKMKLDFLTEKSSFLFKEKIADGWHYWRVRAETPQFTSPWTPAAPFQIKHEESSFNFVASEKVQEQENKRLESLRTAQLREAAKQQAEFAAEEAQIEEKLRPILEAPEDLDGPSNFALELGSVPANKGAIESLPKNEQMGLVRIKPVLEWHPVTDATDYRVEFSADDNFTTIIDTGETNRPSLRWSRPRPGVYYWRVLAMSKRHRNSQPSESKRLELTLSPPTASSPHAVLIRESERAIILRWLPTLFAKTYEVEWASDPEFATKITGKASVSAFKQPLISQGNYYWRVRPLDDQGKALTPFSTIQPIGIAFAQAQTAQLKVPLIEFPFDNQVIVVPEGDRARVSFYWQSPPFEGVYLVELAKDAAFTQLITQGPTKKREFNIELPKDTSNFYWRLKLSQQGQIVWTSAPRKVIIKTGGPSRQTAGEK